MPQKQLWWMPEFVIVKSWKRFWPWNVLPHRAFKGLNDCWHYFFPFRLMHLLPFHLVCKVGKCQKSTLNSPCRKWNEKHSKIHSKSFIGPVLLQIIWKNVDVQLCWDSFPIKSLFVLWNRSRFVNFSLNCQLPWLENSIRMWKVDVKYFTST